MKKNRQSTLKHHRQAVLPPRDIVTALIIILAVHGLIAFVCGFVFLSTLGA